MVMGRSVRARVAVSVAFLAVALAGCAGSSGTLDPAVAVAASEAAPPPARPAARPPAPPPTETLVYGNAPSQIIEVFMPAGPGPHPVAVFIHGGCYVSTNGNLAGMRRTYADLANRGVVVWGVGYRRVDEVGGAFPGIFQDLAGATDRVRAEAGRLNLDLDRVVLVGHSAGGHLALWAAGRARIPANSPLHQADPLRVRGVFSIAGPGDIAPLETLVPRTCGAGVFERLVGVASPERPDRFADTSPAALLPLGVPTRLLVGGTDTVVPPIFLSTYESRARAAGDAVSMRVIHGADHGDVVRPGHAAWAAIADEIAAALR